METTFDSRMHPIETFAQYPAYARKKGPPQERARKILDGGKPSAEDERCTHCIGRAQECVRWREQYGKCAFCTGKDLGPGHCRLPGEPEGVPPPRKRKKMNSDIDGASTATPVSLTGTRSDFRRSAAPSPEGFRRLAPAAIANTGAVADATLERVTALESQVARLEEEFIALLTKLEELSSSVGQPSPSFSPHNPDHNMDASPTFPQRSKGDRSSFNSFASRIAADRLASKSAKAAAVQEWANAEGTPKHTVQHSDEWAPANCICAAARRQPQEGPLLPKDAAPRNAVVASKDADMADANGMGY